MVNSGIAPTEYVVIAFYLITTCGIGVWASRKRKTTLNDYMFGGQQIGLFPITLSLIATFLSGTAQTAMAQESYLFGSSPTIPCAGYGVAAIIAAFCYLPVTYEIKNVSPFEYLDKRFNTFVRKIASVLFAFQAITHSSISIYIPAVTFSQVSGLPMFPIACVLGLVCLICTAVGGLKSVAWSDAFQSIILIISCVVCFALGIVRSGGVGEILIKLEQGSRLEPPDFSFSFYPRYTFWNGISASILPALIHHLSPAFHQRFVAAPTFKEAKRSILLAGALVVPLSLITFVMGLLVYAYYAGCDPVLSKKGIKSYSTILPYFILEVAKDIPGISGLFYASVMAAGLSTTTSLWNAVSCQLYEDFIRPRIIKVRGHISDEASYKVLMMLVLIISLISFAFVYLPQFMGTLIEASMVMKTTTLAPLFVLFNSGLFIPWVNSIGALSGAVATVAVYLTIAIGAKSAQRANLLKDLPKILTTEFCGVNNGTMPSNSSSPVTYGTTGFGIQQMADPSVFWLFRISVMYYFLVGVVVGLIVSVIVSFLTGAQPLDKLDPRLIVPQLRWILGKQKPTAVNCNGMEQHDMTDCHYTVIQTDVNI